MIGARTRKPLRRLVLLTSSAALVTSGALVAPAAQAATPSATATSGWLVSGLQDGMLYTTYDGQQYTNDGVTLDAVIGMQRIDGRAAARKRVIDRFQRTGASYYSPGGADSAGAIGKTLTAVQGEGIAPDEFVDGLDERLEDLVTTTGSETGRASDAGTTDYSNTVTQGYVVRALALAGSDLTDEAVEFLLKQQCDQGYFRTYLESADNTCDGGTAGESAPSVDSTAFAVLALRQVQRSDAEGGQAAAIGTALAEARSWLLARQANNGSFGDGGVRNANSTGLAAWALTELGRKAVARDSARWVAQLRVTPALARRTPLDPADVGAIAFNGPDLVEAKRRDIRADKLYYWQNASAQALFSQNLIG